MSTLSTDDGAAESSARPAETNLTVRHKPRLRSSSWILFLNVVSVVLYTGISNVRTSFKISNRSNVRTSFKVTNRILEQQLTDEKTETEPNRTTISERTTDSLAAAGTRAALVLESSSSWSSSSSSSSPSSSSTSTLPLKSANHSSPGTSNTTASRLSSWAQRHNSSVPVFDTTILDKIKPWDDNTTWTHVTQDMYHHLVDNAKQDLQHQLDNYVDTNCKLHIAKQNDMSVHQQKPVRLLFECLQNSKDDGHKDLQDEPCHPASSSVANVCLVVTNDDIPRNQIDKPANDDEHYNYTSRSALLMLVDSLEYLWKDKVTRGSNFTYWKSFLNKASYARRTERPFFIWIGHIPPSELNSRNNNLDLYQTLGAPCQPRETTNKMHYYKPLLFESVLHKQSIVEKRIDSAIFLDADNSFTNEAFRVRTQTLDRLLGPEDYLALSPQASIMGSQNTAGEIVMNGGLLLLRNTPVLEDFNAFWWYTRCGNKDQRGLWLVLLTMWSATTSSSSVLSSQPTSTTRKARDFTNDNLKPSVESINDYLSTTSSFGFPGIMFMNYNYATSITLTHIRRHIADIQMRWKKLWSFQSSSIAQQHQESNRFFTDRFLPRPGNTTLHDGGKFVRKGYLTAPLELPHVMLLPLTSWTHHEVQTDGKTRRVLLPGLKAEIYDEEKEPFIMHKKYYDDVCRRGKCLPWYEEF